MFTDTLGVCTIIICPVNYYFRVEYPESTCNNMMRINSIEICIYSESAQKSASTEPTLKYISNQV